MVFIPGPAWLLGRMEISMDAHILVPGKVRGPLGRKPSPLMPIVSKGIGNAQTVLIKPNQLEWDFSPMLLFEPRRSPESHNPVMLELKPACENCRVPLPPNSTEARICLAEEDGLLPPAFENADAHSIYIVDDEPGLTELYTIFLQGTGYVVKTFNDRAEALATLKEDTQKPDLLILDYFGHPMPVEDFMELCLIAHPRLRILMASGLIETETRFSSIRPTRFIQKPFTAWAFVREVHAALSA
jgi:CheY-like chemotaxis protein